ncbi:MAG: hypothetical protein AAF389_08140 [Gemmatimonadota bacterium]
MKITRRFGPLLALMVAVSACEIFEDQSPENLSFRLTGSAGTQVTAIYSTRFVAGVDEFGVTTVRVFGSDTVVHTLPIDTVISIAANQQFFVQVQPADTVDVQARVDIDGRNVLDNEGFIFPDSPWNYVYQFNQLLTEVVEVVL